MKHNEFIVALLHIDTFNFDTHTQVWSHKYHFGGDYVYVYVLLYDHITLTCASEQQTSKAVEVDIRTRKKN